MGSRKLGCSRNTVLCAPLVITICSHGCAACGRSSVHVALCEYVFVLELVHASPCQLPALVAKDVDASWKALRFRIRAEVKVHACVCARGELGRQATRTRK